MSLGLGDITYYPELSTPDSNLADYADSANSFPIPRAGATGLPYVACDGTHIGWGSNCAGPADELTLTGLGDLSALDALDLPRFTWGAAWAPMLVAGLHGYGRSHSLIGAALWALIGYVAPLPAVGVALFEQGTRKALVPHVMGY